MEEVLKAEEGHKVFVYLPGPGRQEVTIVTAGGGLVVLKLADGSKITASCDSIVLVGPPYSSAG